MRHQMPVATEHTGCSTPRTPEHRQHVTFGAHAIFFRFRTHNHRLRGFFIPDTLIPQVAVITLVHGLSSSQPLLKTPRRMVPPAATLIVGETAPVTAPALRPA